MPYFQRFLKPSNKLLSAKRHWILRGERRDESKLTNRIGISRDRRDTISKILKYFILRITKFHFRKESPIHRANSSKYSEESFKVAIKKTRHDCSSSSDNESYEKRSTKSNPDFPRLFLPVTRGLTPLRTLSRVTVVTYCPFLEEIRRVHCFIARWRERERKRSAMKRSWNACRGRATSATAEEADDEVTPPLDWKLVYFCHDGNNDDERPGEVKLAVVSGPLERPRSWRLDGLFWLHDRPRIIASADHGWLVIFERRSLCCRMVIGSCARGSKKLNWKD